MTWKEFITERKLEVILTLFFLAGILFIFPKFLTYVEQREGVVLPDPILKLFNPVDLTWLTFTLIYISLVIAILNFSLKPELLFTALQSYTLLVILRMIVMYITPFNAPEKLVPLNDPFVQMFGSGDILTKDLFFSGHTATLFLLFLITDKKYLKIIFITCTLLVGISVILQHVHYTVDVVTAPFFAYVSLRLVKLINDRITESIKSTRKEKTLNK